LIRRDGRDGRDGRVDSLPIHGNLTVPTALTVPTVPTCQRCSFPVPFRLSGCKNPCANCGTIYPLGDCSD